ncbi:GyrI-like domain-containing protein [Nesterenkonia jeotgali]|uniref:GyrI-like small molecule binding domain-containing protein n=1 Tax=Nesterenkonia jeotgali TaxID=317018 RepID=A0A839FN25_9MICC|nr:GyrI-like domain-containing protein [Nesterenkonia jeotgali]MBA8920835.1 hypothetical protein [Nesterenkonia jeotgali]
MTLKIDFKKSLPGYQAPSGEYQIVEIPDRHYMMIDGQGDPNTSEEYSASLAALYPVAYALKFASKNELDRDYVVPPLEGLWWAEDMSVFTSSRDSSRWRWTLMLLVPDWIDDERISAAIAAVRAKSSPLRLDALRLETLVEGRCVQTLHLGSFEEEGRTLEPMHRDFMPSHGLEPTGKHHEIYLSDPRRTAAGKLRTILRQPVGQAKPHGLQPGVAPPEAPWRG